MLLEECQTIVEFRILLQHQLTEVGVETIGPIMTSSTEIITINITRFLKVGCPSCHVTNSVEAWSEINS